MPTQERGKIGVGVWEISQPKTRPSLHIFCIFGCGSKLNRRGYAGFGPYFSTYQGSILGSGFLSLSHFGATSALKPQAASGAHKWRAQNAILCRPLPRSSCGTPCSPKPTPSV